MPLPITRVTLLAVAALALVGARDTRADQPPTPEKPELRVPAPDFPEGVTWLNSKPLTLKELRGKVVLVDFWEYTCVNCIRTFPYLKAWNERYKDKGLVIIGVHTPEFRFAKEQPNVAKAAKQFGLTYPLIVDSDYAVWNTYGNRYWPAKFLIDKNGDIRNFHFGEGGYGDTEAAIQKLLKEIDPKVQLPPVMEPIRGSDKPGAVCYPATPELYAGYERGAQMGTLGNKEGYHPGKVVHFKDSGTWSPDALYANGPWRNTPEALVSTEQSPSPRSYVGLKYKALEVNAVMKPENGKPVRVWVYHDGKPVAKKDAGSDVLWDPQGRSYMVVDRPRMYNVIKNAEFGQRRLKLATAEPGLGVYSFTFVSCQAAK